MLGLLASVWAESPFSADAKDAVCICKSTDSSDDAELTEGESTNSQADSEDETSCMPGAMPQSQTQVPGPRRYERGSSSQGGREEFEEFVRITCPTSDQPPSTTVKTSQTSRRMDAAAAIGASVPTNDQSSSSRETLPPGSASNLPVSQSRQRDEELWYPDGNIVLIAKGIEFQVYQGPLMEHSRVFQDMLTMPQPPPTDTQSGPGTSPTCVTINLDDSPEDLRHFLRVFVGKSFLYGGFHPTYHEISSCIRLADKYECTMLMQRSIEYLKRYFHDNFDAWKDDAAVFAPPKFERIHCVGVVNLARLTHQDKMLPGALMGCCQLGAEIADGFAREDGGHEALSTQDLARCFVGRAKLIEWNTRATLRILHQEVHAECRQREQCAVVLLKMLKSLEEGSVLYSLRWDWSWMPWLDREDPDRELCGVCYGMLGKHGRQKEQQRIIFDQLPALMGVEVKHWGKTDEEIARIEAEEAATAAAAAAIAAASEHQGDTQTNTQGAQDVSDDDDNDDDSSEDEDSDGEGEDSDA